MKRMALQVIGFILIYMAFALFVLAGSAYAFQVTPQDPQLPIPGLPPIKLGGSWWAGLIVGIVGGIQAMFVGMLKKATPEQGMPKFDYKLVLKTLIIGVIVGMIAHFMNWSPSDASAWMVTAPMGGVVTAGVEDLVNLIWRKLYPPKPAPAS